MMVRSQITLDPELQRAARQKAAQMGISFAEYVRQLVRRDLSAPDVIVDPSRVFDLGSSKRSDVRCDKDAMIGDAMVAGCGLGESDER
jgi:hypothetical protein